MSQKSPAFKGLLLPESEYQANDILEYLIDELTCSNFFESFLLKLVTPLIFYKGFSEKVPL